MSRFLSYAMVVGFAALTAHAQASITVTDDMGNQVTLAKPAQRIISLSPHVTEMIYVAGAGDRIIGTVKYSDYPAAAKNIPNRCNIRELARSSGSRAT